jgi:hypothetical protein
MNPKKTLITTYYTDVTDLSDAIIDLRTNTLPHVK